MKSVVRLTADIHKGHRGILKFCRSTRPFVRIEDHDQAVRAAWIAAGIQKDDLTIVVGDFAHREADEKALRNYFDTLPGRKALVIGNHDGDATRRLPWEFQKDIAYLSIDSQRVVLCHYMMASFPGNTKDPGALQLFGHHHGRIKGNSRQCDVGVDVFGLAPVRLNVIKAHLATLPPYSNPEGNEFGNDLDGGPTL